MTAREPIDSARSRTSVAVDREVLQIRHSSFCTPRDFDISPYFQIVKPSLVGNFNYKVVDWADLSAPPQAGGKANVAQTSVPDRESSSGSAATNADFPPERVETSGETVFFYIKQPKPLLDALAANHEVRYLHRPANLEDLFLKLTGRQIRDDA